MDTQESGNSEQDRLPPASTAQKILLDRLHVIQNHETRLLNQIDVLTESHDKLLEFVRKVDELTEFSKK